MRKSSKLTETQERVLKAVNALPFASAQEITRWVFSRGSLSSARAHLREMAGGEDGNDNGYLLRVGLPTRGNWLRLYVVGSPGAAYLRQIGVEVTWRVRASRLLNYSFGFLRHQHAVAQLLTALHCFCRCRENPAHQVVETLTSYDVWRDPPRASVIADGQDREVAVIPDAWVYVERVADRQGTALWFEIDNNGNEYRKKYQQLLRGRLSLLKNGYAEYFGTPAVLLCYLVTGTTMTPAHRNTRMHTLRRWTQEVLAKEQLEDWGSVFRFAVVEEDIYTTPLWDAPVWRLADDTDEPMRLFEPITPDYSPVDSEGQGDN